MTPTEISVSIVAVRCRRFVHAARWKGQAPHTTTGDARARASHCQLPNWSAAIIDSATTGALSAAQTASRWSHPAAASSSAASALSAGSVAAYPVASTAAIRSRGRTPSVYSTVAVSVAKLTLARTPSMRLRLFSTRAAQEAHVIPSTARLTEPMPLSSIAVMHPSYTHRGYW